MTDAFGTGSERRRRTSAADGPSDAPPTVASGEKWRIPERRIRHARETKAALHQIQFEPTRANIVAWHELHATHLREKGDDDAAGRAHERAQRARESAIAPFDRSSQPDSLRRLAAADDAPHLGVFDDARPITTAGQERAGETTQVQYALAAAQRADAALQRAVEGSERADTNEARARAARARSAAAKRRLAAAEARQEASTLRLPLGESEDDPIDERDRVADERERIADERERIADERDKRADQRDKAADGRERAADDHDRIANERQRFLDALEGNDTNPT